MKFLNIKLRRDLLRDWRQFFSVFLMAFLSVLIFVGLQGSWRGLEVSLEEYNTSSNLADSWVYGTGFNEQDISDIKATKGVKEAAEKTRIKVAVSGVGKQEKYLSLDSYSNKNISKLTSVKGEAIDEKNTGDVWLNKEYANENNLKIGDKINVKYAGKSYELKIGGLIQSAERTYYTGSPEFIAPNYSNYGYGFITENTLKNTLHYQGLPNVLELRNQNRDIRENIEDVLGEKHIAFYNQATLSDVSNALDRVGQIRNLSFLFSFIFILLAVLAMYTTIRRLIETQTKEIAVLKALGFSNRLVGTHYASYGLLVGGGGALLGTIVAPVMSLFVLSTQKTMFSIPTWKISYGYSSLFVILFVISICVLASFLASRQAISGLPALFLRGEAPKKVERILLERITPLWKRLKFEHRWAIRDAAINKVRMMMGIIGVAGGMMLLTAGFGMPDSINHLVDKAYNQDFSYDKRIESNAFDSIDKKYEGQSVQITPARYTPDDGFNRTLMVLSDGKYINMKTKSNERIDEGGIYVTEGFADRSDIKAGDQISVRPALDSKTYSFKVKGIIVSETNQGAYIKQKTWENAGGKFNPQTLLVGASLSFNTLQADKQIDSIIKISEQQKNADEFVASLMSIFMMIIGFAVLLVIVVLYNLGSLNFVERIRDYATLRVLGFHKKELRNITMIENIITTFIGWIIGIPLGIWFLDTYVRTFSTIQLEYTSYISLGNLALASAVTWICSLTTTFLIGRRIQKVDMVEALKSVD